jgi:glycosyltransferase involved in cell wall biosynthesis
VRRLLVVSHPAVVAVNQEVYLELLRRGDWDVTLVVPDRWRHDYAPGTFAPEPLPGLEGRLVPLPVVLAGRPQRHVYRARLGRVLREHRPDVVFLEAESYSLAALQWSGVVHRTGVPFGVQCAENLDRPLPVPVRRGRARVLERAAFVAARSHSAAALARRWGATGTIGFAPHAVPPWPAAPPAPAGRPFTVGYAGRLVPEKDPIGLLEAVERLGGDARLVLFGDGPLRGELEAAGAAGRPVTVRSDVAHEAMAAAYAEMDVLALPSRTTPTWTEQFGRVLVEALWCGVPVVGTASGEIPWVIEATGGGLVVPEGDGAALTGALRALRDDPARRAALASAGRATVQRMFSLPAAADALAALLQDAA